MVTTLLGVEYLTNATMWSANLTSNIDPSCTRVHVLEMAMPRYIILNGCSCNKGTVSFHFLIVFKHGTNYMHDHNLTDTRKCHNISDSCHLKQLKKKHMLNTKYRQKDYSTYEKMTCQT